MSFYFDSEDDEAGDHDFVCPNCGGTRSYADESGHLFCALCFSQSQTQQNEAEFEYDEVQALVARGRGGQMMGVTYAGGKRERQRTRQPMDSYDVSRPLPSLEDCLQAYTAVIQGCLESASQILGLNDRQSDTVKNSVRHVWLAYLKSWQDGAEFYKKYHPEVRISLRDSFLHRPRHKSNMFRVLTNQAMERIKKEREENSDSESDSDADGDGSSDDEGSSDDDESDEKERQNKCKFKAVATLPSMLDLYKRKGPMGGRIAPVAQHVDGGISLAN